MFYKPEIREKLLSRRCQVDEVTRQRAANAVASQVIQLDQFLKSTHIGIYIAMGGELDPMPIIQTAAPLHKKLYLPILLHKGVHEAQILQFNPYSLGDELSKSPMGFQEPLLNHVSAIEPYALDLVIVPLVGFDRHCNRLGRGGGHYDRTFEFLQKGATKPILLGLAYEFQQVSDMKPSSWDIPLSIVVTEENIYTRMQELPQ